MEEIKVGLYGRTNLGNIIKFAYLCDENNERYTNKVILIDEVSESPRAYYYFKEDERIVKESKNIIDLIEVGDYVNGKLVKHIADFEGVKEPIRKLIFVDEHRLVPGETAENDDIKTIVTKEQFENAEYKVEE